MAIRVVIHTLEKQDIGPGRGQNGEGRFNLWIRLWVDQVAQQKPRTGAGQIALIGGDADGVGRGVEGYDRKRRS